MLTSQHTATSFLHLAHSLFCSFFFLLLLVCFTQFIFCLRFLVLINTLRTFLFWYSHIIFYFALSWCCSFTRSLASLTPPIENRYVWYVLNVRHILFAYVVNIETECDSKHPTYVHILFCALLMFIDIKYML